MGFWPSPIENFHTDTYDAINPSNPNLSTKGKSIFITGGGSGIGPEIARAFAEAGSTSICIIGRTEKTLLSTKASLESTFSALKVSTYVADITDSGALEKAFSSFSAEAGPIQVLVCNAAYFPDGTPLIDGDSDEFWKGFEINVRGNLNVVRAFAPYATSNPTVINIGTGASFLSPNMLAGTASYPVSKLASQRVFEYLQAEKPDWDVFTEHPGVIETNMNSKSGIVLPFDKIQLPAHFTVWLASDDAKFLKGRFVWASWDIEEMKTKEKLITQGETWTTGLQGWPKLEQIVA